MLTKEGRKISDLFIPHGLNSSSRIRVGVGVGFTPKSEEQEDTAHQDIQIHHIPSFTSDESVLEEGEFIEVIEGLNPAPYLA